ncbi:hypothetical protein RB653_002802 [Dictyostelium firmibasis]|uniref:Uncharacterized protein n=1 Tax=Dictyostelium firmibasis TaxID=79012 RepID=A0AAN7TR46_9MYCE
MDNTNISHSNRMVCGHELCKERKYAREFGKQFVHIFGVKHLSSYLHIFIEHTGYFLNKAKGSQERIANFGIN